MPTRERREYAQCALTAFLSQTYNDRELVILDDADAPSFPDGVSVAGVVYHRATERLTIPEKRNAVNSLAVGDVIVHWDSDDWSAPTRIAEQAERLRLSGLAMTAYYSMLFVTESGEWHMFHGEQSLPTLGTSLMYWRHWWQSHPFDVKRRIASDVQFAREAAYAREISSAEAGALMVARIHSGNASPKKTYHNKTIPCFRPWTGSVPELFPAGVQV